MTEFLDLFRPKWRHSNWKVRIVAVSRISDDTLQHAVGPGEEQLWDDKRKTALGVLAKIAASDEHADVRKAAIEVLADTAKNHERRLVCMAAVKHLTDQSVLADIAKNANYAEVGLEAVKGVTDQSVLADIAKNGENSSKVREVARGRVTDHGLLADIATRDEFWRERKEEREEKNARFMAKRYLTNLSPLDKKILADAAENKRYALELLTNHNPGLIRAYLRYLARVWWSGQPESRTVATCDACSVGPVGRNEGFLLGSWLWCKSCYKDKDVEGQLKRDPNYAGHGLVLAALSWVANDTTVPASLTAR